MTTRCYTKDHEWWTPVDGQPHRFRIGITSYAVSQLGEVVFMELPGVGKAFKTGESVAVVESVKAAADVYAPFAGTITEVNADLRANPAQIGTTNDPWLFVLEVSTPPNPTDYLDAKSYAALTGFSV